MVRPTLVHPDKIRTDVNVDHIHDQIDVEDIKYFANAANKNNIEDKAMALMVLRCMPGEASTRSQYTQQQQKKARTSFNPGKPYHRWFLCADLTNPPHCFAILTDNLGQTNRLLIHNLDDTYMGKSFYLIEPSVTKDKQGSYLHLLHCDDTELMPLKWNERVSNTPMPIELPPSSEETFYFSLQNQYVTLHKCRAPTDPSCTGFQCDRSKKKGECLCLSLTPGTPLVYAFDVEFDVNPKLFKGNSTHVVPGFRSLRTTAVFFSNFMDFSATNTFERERTKQVTRRKQMKQLTDYINDHGGWTIVGWCRKGKVTVEGESERIANSEVNLNLTSLYPSNHDLFKDAEFQKLQITHDNDDTATANPRGNNAATTAQTNPNNTATQTEAQRGASSQQNNAASSPKRSKKK